MKYQYNKVALVNSSLTYFLDIQYVIVIDAPPGLSSRCELGCVCEDSL